MDFIILDMIQQIQIYYSTHVIYTVCKESSLC